MLRKIFQFTFFLFLLGVMFRAALPANAFDASKPLSDNNPIPYTQNDTNSPNATYAAAVQHVSPASAATDVYCISGSSTKTVYVTRAQFSADATASASIDVLLIKRTTADTGAASTVTAIPYDSNDGAATATLKQYNVNPTISGVGVTIRADELGVALDVNGYPNQPLVWDFGTRSTKFMILRGVNESLCFNLNAQTLPAGLELYDDFEWIEK
jgi:hypothetical protein